jgi:nicotinamidase-related amidase
VRQYAKHGTIITKETFGSDELMLYLKTYTYDLIEIVGVVSHMCVMANAIITKTVQPNATIRVLRKLTAGFNPKLHEATFKLLQNLHIDVL